MYDRAHVPVKMAMKKEQMPIVRRDRRKTRFSGRFTFHVKKEFLLDPLILDTSLRLRNYCTY